MEKLATERILLRAFKHSDLEDLRVMMTDADVMKKTRFRTAQPDLKIQECLEKWIYENDLPFGVWAAEDKKEGHFLGWFMLKKTVSEFPEIGFMLPKKQWGRGYASEACVRILEYAFEELGMDKVIAAVDPTNSASINVLVKLGMQRADYSEKTEAQDALYFEIGRRAR